MQNTLFPRDTVLAEMLGTFLQISALSAPEACSLRDVADRFRAWARRQPVARLDRVYDHLLTGMMEPSWDELGLASTRPDTEAFGAAGDRRGLAR